MRVLMAMLSASWLFTASADEVYFVELKEFKQWPAPAQQAYVLGAVDQALVDAYLFDAASYRRIVECMSNVDTNAMFQSTLEGILKETYEDESLTLLIGDGIYEFCEQKGYPLE